jgi:hypothetical protein
MRALAVSPMAAAILRRVRVVPDIHILMMDELWISGNWHTNSARYGRR